MVNQLWSHARGCCVCVTQEEDDDDVETEDHNHLPIHDEEMGLGASGRNGSSGGELGGKMHSVVKEEPEEEEEDGSGGAGSSGPQDRAEVDAGEGHAGLDLCGARMRPGLEELKHAKERCVDGGVWSKKVLLAHGQCAACTRRWLRGAAARYC